MASVPIGTAIYARVSTGKGQDTDMKKSEARIAEGRGVKIADIDSF